MFNLMSNFSGSHHNLLHPSIARPPYYHEGSGEELEHFFQTKPKGTILYEERLLVKRK